MLRLSKPIRQKYSRFKKNTLQCDVYYGKISESAQIDVENDGIGLDVLSRYNIFEQYFRTGEAVCLAEFFYYLFFVCVLRHWGRQSKCSIREQYLNNMHKYVLYYLDTSGVECLKNHMAFPLVFLNYSQTNKFALRNALSILTER